MANRKAVNAAAVATTAVAFLWSVLFFHPFPPDIDARPHAALGQALADEAVKLLQPGARLVVIARDSQPFEVPAAETQLNAFLQVLKKSGHSVSALRLLKVDPLRVVSVPPGEFFDLLRQSGDEDVIVSFLGPPVLRDEQVAKLGQKRPRVLAVCSGAMPVQVDLKRIFDQRLLTTAVVSRSDAPAQAGLGSARAAFEQLFKVITPGNLSELPALAAVRR